MVQNCQKNWMTWSEPIVKKKPWASYCSGKKEEKNTTRITPDSNRTVRHRNFLQPLLPDFLLRKDQDPDGQWTGVYKDFKHTITTETFIFTFILLHGVISFTFIFPHFLAGFFFTFDSSYETSLMPITNSWLYTYSVFFYCMSQLL